MSTVSVTNLKHESASGNNISLTNSGAVGVGTASPAEKLTLSGGNLRLMYSGVSPTRIQYFNSTGSYQVGVSGGAAIAFHEVSGSQEIGFETHWTGFQHSETMRITKEGYVKTPYQPMFWAYRTGSGNVTSETNLSCDAADVNIGGHYDTTTFRFTAPVAGTYFFIVHAMNNQTNPGSSTVHFRKNGSKYHYFHIVNNHPSSSTTNVIMTLQAGDYADATASNIHYNGGSIYKYPAFGGFLIG